MPEKLDVMRKASRKLRGSAFTYTIYFGGKFVNTPYRYEGGSSINYKGFEYFSDFGTFVDYVDDCFRKPAFMAAFKYSFQPVSGPNVWPRSENDAFRVTEPKHRRMSCRPKLTRIRDRDEPRKSTKKSQSLPSNASDVVPRSETLQVCGLCKQPGHNKRTCKNNMQASSGAGPSTQNSHVIGGKPPKTILTPTFISTSEGRCCSSTAKKNSQKRKATDNAADSASEKTVERQLRRDLEALLGLPRNQGIDR